MQVEYLGPEAPSCLIHCDDKKLTYMQVKCLGPEAQRFLSMHTCCAVIGVRLECVHHTTDVLPNHSTVFLHHQIRRLSSPTTHSQLGHVKISIRKSLTGVTEGITEGITELYSFSKC